ncbi:MAG: HAE1 family hydrophobic/amphiphilic exporter-1 [Shewanella psychromarinicola]|jgi:HAE1 family hydrophobic/amphiphilic exporter-1
MVFTAADSENRITVATVIFFNMAFATVVALLVIPAMYRLISSSTHSLGLVEAQLNDAIAAQKAQQP